MYSFYLYFLQQHILNHILILPTVIIQYVIIHSGNLDKFNLYDIKQKSLVSKLNHFQVFIIKFLIFIVQIPLFHINYKIYGETNLGLQNYCIVLIFFFMTK